MTILIVATSAAAQAYDFEGKWEQSGNGCNQADVFTAREMRSFAAGGSCRFTRLSPAGSATYRYEARCNDDTGRYSTSGTIQMLGANRMTVRDRRMQGQVTEYTRC